MQKTITILGSTGSIGTQALDVIGKCGMKALALTANRSVDLLEKQIRQYNPLYAAMADEKAAAELAEALAELDAAAEALDAAMVAVGAAEPEETPAE